MKTIAKIISLLLFINIGTAQQNNSSFDKELLKNAQYRLVGPFRGGRCDAVCGDLNNKNTFYMGVTGGGVWKTVDGGSTWKNISDNFFGGSIGAIAIAPSDADVIYVGEGEATLRGNVSEGFGIWKSTDGGRNWINIGLKDSRHISRIVIHPKNPDIVWVAAIGHLFGPNAERGVFKTIDGGKTWKKVLFADENSGAVDLVMEPGNPKVFYASTWTVKRTPYSLESGGKGSALWKSIDGGETWSKLNNKKGFPSKTTLGIIGVSVAATNPDKVYALIENENGGLYVSNNGGESWQLQNSENKIRQRAWYYTKVFVDPKNENTVYILNVDFHKSTDEGKTFRDINTNHGDHHDLWIDPSDNKRMIIGDDGGGQISFNGGENFSTYYNQPTAQFYRVSTDNHFPYRILGAQQDNSTVRILSRSNSGSINMNHWSSTAGAESGYVVADPLNPNVVYGGNYGGYLSRYDHKTGEDRTISVWPINPLGAGADMHQYRFQWNFPIFFSPHNPKKLYAAGNVLFYSENEGASWTPISGDLTTNDKTRQGASGGPITKDNTGVETYCTIFTACESPLEKDLIWAGSDDGLLHVTIDGGKNWKNVTPPTAGKWMMWNCIEPDPFKKGKAYVVGTKYKSDDYTPYLYKTEDYGKTWKLITGGIPSTHFTRCLRADKKIPGLLYCGTEYGMYISYNDGATWNPFQLNLPIVPITDLTIKENDLIVATQGRAFWVLDDLSTVQQYDKNIATKSLHVYNVNAAYLFDGYKKKKVTNEGSNPDFGVVINYYLKNYTDSSSVQLIIKDKNKKTVKTYSSNEKTSGKKLECEKGLNKFVWDMYYPDVIKIDGMIMWSGIEKGPKAAPGIYFVTVKTEKDSIEKQFEIKSNPTYACTQNDYEAQFNFLLQVADKFNEVQQTILDVRELRKQINDFKQIQNKESEKELIALCDSVVKKITIIEESLYQTKLKSSQDILNFPMKLNNKIANLYDYASSGNNAPTQQVKDAYAILSKEADAEMAKFLAVLTTDIPNLNKKIKSGNANIIGIKIKNK